MATYTLPSKSLPSFNPSVFSTTGKYLTQSTADSRYFPLGGGTMNGSMTINGTETATNVAIQNTLAFSDNSVMVTSPSASYDYTQMTNGLALISALLVSNICCSSTGQFVLMGSTSGAYYVSSNYGQSFTSYTQSPLNTVCVCMSGSGQYQILYNRTVNTTAFLSTNFGASFSAIASIGSTVFSSICMSLSGQYVYASIANSPYTLYISTNYGTSFTGTNYPSRLVTMNCSASGQFVTYTLGGSNQLYYSANYAQSFSLIYTNATNSVYGASISADGKTIVMSCNGGAGVDLGVSRNGGQTWTTDSSNNNGFVGMTQVTSDGKCAICLTNAPTALLITNNYGVSWTTGFNNTAYSCYSMALSADGRTFYLANSNGIYSSVTPIPSLSIETPTRMIYSAVPTLSVTQIGYSFTNTWSVTATTYNSGFTYNVYSATLPSIGVWLVTALFGLAGGVNAGSYAYGFSPTSATTPVAPYLAYFSNQASSSQITNMNITAVINTTTWTGGTTVYFCMAGSGITCSYSAGSITYTRIA